MTINKLKDFLLKSIDTTLASKVTTQEDIGATKLILNGTSFLSSFLGPNTDTTTKELTVGGIILSLKKGDGTVQAEKGDFLQDSTGAALTPVTTTLKLKIDLTNYNMGTILIDLSSMKKLKVVDTNKAPVAADAAVPANILTPDANDKSLSVAMAKEFTWNSPDEIKTIFSSIFNSKTIAELKITYDDPTKGLIQTAFENDIKAQQVQGDKDIKAMLETFNTKSDESTSAIKEIKTGIDGINTSFQAKNSSVEDNLQYTVYAVATIAIASVISTGLSMYQMNNSIDSVKNFNDEYDI